MAEAKGRDFGNTAEVVDFKKGKMMKNAFVWMILGVILCSFLCGCAQLGETTAEGRRRHIRTARINQQELMGDLDRVGLADKPSKLTDKRIP